jgi:hypothetical protein
MINIDSAKDEPIKKDAQNKEPKEASKDQPKIQPKVPIDCLKVLIDRWVQFSP